ncbi:hypothetical protein PR048_029787 [Dryococelus australis]|uniref:Uncharacterized protein n=1 Tax=Dryococelus australis TaxID=614101 RepID=A0ABQ9G9S2_9NEOP|nr:hypothetical protein PR048_029787 [Dryococelus australis]
MGRYNESMNDTSLLMERFTRAELTDMVQVCGEVHGKSSAAHRFYHELHPNHTHLNLLIGICGKGYR